MKQLKLTSGGAAFLACVFILALGVPRNLHGGESNSRLVLFVGDSLVDYWNSTMWAAKIAKSLGATPPLDTQAVTLGALEALNEHLSNTYGSKGLVAIRTGGWDIVVLQENPYEPLMRPNGFSAAVRRLAEAAQETGAEVVLLEPFAIAAGSVVYHASESWSGGSPSAMQALLRRTVAQLADQLKLQVAPVGDAFEWVHVHDPELDLYEHDKLHPSPCGAFLQACVFAAVLTGKDPRNSAWLPENGVSEAEAKVLRAAAWTVVQKP